VEACKICGKRLAEYACDMPKFRSITRIHNEVIVDTHVCDRHICKQCALSNGNDIHICKICAKELKEGFKWKVSE